MLLQTSIPLKYNARKYCLDIVYKSCYGARKQRKNIELAQSSMLFAYRFRPYYKIHTRDLVLNPDQWRQRQQKKKNQGGGRIRKLWPHDPKIGGFLPLTNEVGNKFN